ncbi:MAG TPA: 6-pyruvoyl-tetrahydropterin synthase-related protein [Vicinamibacteria bacterium]|jgi:hypothetical protein
MRVSPGRRAVADVLGLGVLLLVLLDLLRPALLLLPTITAGGDTPCHVPTAAWFHERLRPEWRLHGWYPGAYLGHPLLLYYFPFPFLVMSALAGLTGLPVAFKLGTALPVFLLPLLVYAAFRLVRFAFPAPLLGAAAALVFLYVEETPIWGGSIASTLAGEFSYTYGVGFAVLFLGVLVRARVDGRGPWLPAAALALTAYAHGYAVLWAGLTAGGLLIFDPAPRRDSEEGRLRLLGWLSAVAGLAFCLAAPSLVPLLADWGWTTPYDDAWIDVTTRGVLPPLLQPLMAAGVVGIAATLVARLSGGSSDARLLLLGFGSLAGAALAVAGPGLGVIDVRFVPLAQLSLSLCGAAALGWALSRLALADAAALGLALVAVFWADSRSHVLRHWVDWNYSGLEAKELWPAWQELTERLRGGPSDARVAVEYGPVHERAGSIRMYETLPWFSGRSTLEGVYNQASTTTHPVYYLASELFARSPNPFRSRRYSSFDPESALARLRLFNVSQIVAVSPELASALDARPDLVREAVIPPYTLYRLREPGPGYVEPLALAPVRADPRTWRDASYRWFSRKPANRALLVFTDDTRFDLVLDDAWGPPPERPLPHDARVTERVEAEAIHVTTSRPGHPLLVKLSYHPRWRAEGADGPYLVSPGLMLVVPRQRDVRLAYAARTWSDRLGRTLFLAAVGAGLVLVRRRAKRSASRTSVESSPGAEAVAPAVAGWAAGLLRALPLAILLALASLRFLPRPGPPVDVAVLDERASRAFAEERWEAAAEYARHAIDLVGADDTRRNEWLTLRGEALLRSGEARLAVLAFAPVVDVGSGPYRAQALYSGALAREATGDAEGASAWRRSLRADHPGTPWAERLDEPARPASAR